MTQLRNTRHGVAFKRPLIAALLTIGMIVPSAGLVQTAGAVESAAPAAAQTSAAAAQPDSSKSGATKAQDGAAKKPDTAKKQAAQAKPTSPTAAQAAQAAAPKTATTQKAPAQSAPAAKPTTAAPAQSAPAKTQAAKPAAAAEEQTVFYHFYTDPDSEASDQAVLCTVGKPIADCYDFANLQGTKDGYTFAGWYASKDLSGSPIDPSTTIVDKGWAAFYAKWVKAEKTFTLTFETNGGSAIAPQQVKEGESYYPDEPTRDGYTFTGWFADKELTKRFDLINFKIEQDTTVYAGWAKNEPEPETAYYHFYTDPDSEASDQSVLCTVGKPIADCYGFANLQGTKDGYTFAGWYDNKALSGSPIDPKTTIVDKGWAAFYAKWTKNEPKPQQPGGENQTKPETKPTTKPETKPAAKPAAKKPSTKKSAAKKSAAKKTTAKKSAKKSTKKLSKTGSSVASIAIFALALAGAGIVLGLKRAE